MSGYKVFQNGDILDANTDVNPFLMKQTVMVFDDAAARTAALDGDESEGMVTYLKDVGHLQRYDGTDWVAAAGLVEIVTFTSNSTFTKASYPWLRAVRVRCQGGGGAGGGSEATGAGEGSAGGGGAGGVYAESVIAASSLGSSETVTVGAGGARVFGDAGGDGGSSSFGSLVVGIGGGGGPMAGASTVLRSLNGAFASDSGTGEIIIGGSGGGGGIRGNPVPSMGGTGGSSHMGAGGRGSGSGGINEGINGDNGRTYGGGGGGAMAHQNQSARPGGDGAPGIVVVELYA